MAELNLLLDRRKDFQTGNASGYAKSYELRLRIGSRMAEDKSMNLVSDVVATARIVGAVAYASTPKSGHFVTSTFTGSITEIGGITR